ncbi:phospholipase D [Ranunculus cassubicifolius]
MANYNNNNNNSGYPPYGGYPPPPIGTHPPLPPPPQTSDPYQQPHPYAYNSPHSFQYPYPQPAYPTDYQQYPPAPGPPHSMYPYPAPASQYNPYPYPYPNPNLAPPYVPPPPVTQSPPRGSLQYSSSFQYTSSAGYSPSDTQPPQGPHHSHANSFAGFQKQDSLLSYDDGSSSGKPSLDSQFNSMKISDSYPSAPPSPSVQSSENPLQGYQSVSGRYNQRVDMYGYPNTSFNNTAELPNAPQSAYGSTPSFDSSQHGQSLQIVPVPSNKGSLRVMLLHGNLDMWVYAAKNLPNMDMFHRTLTDMFGKRLPGIPGSVSGSVDGRSNKVTSDPYVTVSLANAVVGRTYVISNSENPVWTQHFNVPVAHHASEVHFVVKDSDVVGSQIIGLVAIPVEHLIAGNKIEGSFPILSMTSRKPCKPGAELRISIQYVPMEKLTAYDNGVGSGSYFTGVPGTYFPLRQGGKVTLYQDAHVPDGSLPPLNLDHGMQYEHGKCWYDMFNAISQARRLIYITGWSVYHKVRLVRDVPNAPEITLGDLLKSKSQEGVRVLLLIWDDPTSRSILGYQKDGLMGTHDEETRRFFKHSSVQVVLTPRSAGKRHSWAKQQETGMIYTHHQKSVIVDAAAGSKRKIVAFVGGLDLCDGRYDSPQHPLFRTLETLHKDDYHNPSYTGPTAGCPREPWHDLHCKIDGPAAYDVLTNFEERWYKASKPRGISKLKKSNDDALLKIDRIQDIVGMFDAACTNENDPEGWHVQVFRSIDSNSVKGFPKDPRDATNKNLVCGKNVLIDMSIHTAYVNAIRAAQHFIYIENQYFLGSSYNWTQYKDLGANNLIPMEIALKICNKIRAHERFAVYVVVPMWPEGIPTATATQRILFWQNKTMQMMYETIYKALEEAGLEQAFTPQDYLNFFCLGNREAPTGNDGSFGGSPTASNSPQALTKKSRRFMIYVHSKGMIVDDEYVILGSANINQRSMEGTRDTEIAMGAYQPNHTWAGKGSLPRGQIHGYRMSLWAEHTGGLEDLYTQPESIECVRRIRSMGEANWRQFAADDPTDMRGHLLKYPVDVDRRGKVKPLPGSETFPDLGGSIVGTFFAIQENLTI